jgi:hypothetical protein
LTRPHTRAGSDSLDRHFAEVGKNHRSRDQATMIVFFVRLLLRRASILRRLPHVPRHLILRTRRLAGVRQLLIALDQGVAQDEQSRLTVTSRAQPLRHGLNAIRYGLLRSGSAHAKVAFQRGTILRIVIADNEARLRLFPRAITLACHQRQDVPRVILDQRLSLVDLPI